MFFIRLFVQLASIGRMGRIIYAKKRTKLPRTSICMQLHSAAFSYIRRMQLRSAALSYIQLHSAAFSYIRSATFSSVQPENPANNSAP